MALRDDAIGVLTSIACTLWRMNGNTWSTPDRPRDVIDQEGKTFEFYAARLVAAMVTQIFSYMIDSGVRYSYICTGEAFADGELRLHRTAIGQVPAFTLQALAIGPATRWHVMAHDQLITWKVEVLNKLREIP
ncbi:uncharacterized protein BO88DRAFT_458501 [Aspergillus vadensis CBS 113365]|uniref:Uncharacterized protein n=1 Tax=Aspergillus vadensis (strain CBS 113365 / IMI 142717 / IBT 24658) TaxID=1448311 RepID=A0A319AUI0_ASPVC|nr:hypothetical protein BO88DRAFT_458501 [Aspergillus vadensis CBS 113365]PYH64006.1 hypothetical protein BO88DRAFT_458501 [Aspergillus vadensis CBS 113365]